MTIGTPEKVFPTPNDPGRTPPAGGGGTPRGPGAFLRRYRTPLLIGGAAAAVVAGLVANRGNGTDATGEGDPTDPTNPGGYTLDTTATDLYSELQPELENIGDQIGNLADALDPSAPTNPANPGRPPRPGPQIPTPPASHGPHRPPRSPKPPPKKHGPKHRPKHPKGHKGGTSHYTVQRGDTLGAIAKRHHVRGGAARLYAKNRATIEQAAKKHGHKTSRAGSLIFPGTRLVMP